MENLNALSQLILGDVIISFENGEYNVFGQGYEFGFDDAQYYDMTWDPESDEVYSVAYNDEHRDSIIGGGTWSESVSSLEQFADVINNSAEGSWS